jgi:hypothetical protein
MVPTSREVRCWGSSAPAGAIGLATLFGIGQANRPEPVVVVRWANGH